MRPDGATFSGGTIRAPDDDGTCRSEIEFEGDDLSVEGCVLVFCRGQDWRRVERPSTGERRARGGSAPRSRGAAGARGAPTRPAASAFAQPRRRAPRSAASAPRPSASAGSGTAASGSANSSVRRTASNRLAENTPSGSEPPEQLISAKPAPKSPPNAP